MTTFINFIIKYLVWKPNLIFSSYYIANLMDLLFFFFEMVVWNFHRKGNNNTKKVFHPLPDPHCNRHIHPPHRKIWVYRPFFNFRQDTGILIRVETVFKYSVRSQLGFWNDIEMTPHFHILPNMWTEAELSILSFYIYLTFSLLGCSFAKE